TSQRRQNHEAPHTSTQLEQHAHNRSGEIFGNTQRKPLSYFAPPMKAILRLKALSFLLIANAAAAASLRRDGPLPIVTGHRDTRHVGQALA
ncbi:MAG: hypothetical protein J2P56_08645, partial [Verrucomicrobia bacterium]|nr:hypothetical protein [Verrucomicrobiota bacterium]